MSNIYSFLPFVAFLSNAVLLGVGLHRGMSKRVHRDYVYFMTCVTLWTLGDFINWNWSNMPREFTMTIYRLQVPTYIFLAYFFMRFIYSLIGKKADWFYTNFYVIPLTLSIVGVFTPYMVYSYSPVWWGLRHEPGILFIPAAILCIFAPAQYALVLLLNFKTAKDQNEKSQRKLMIAGCCFVLYVGMYTDLVAPHFMGEGMTIQAAGSTVAIMAYCMHRAISKYYMLPFSLGDIVYELFQSSKQGVLIVNAKREVTDMNPIALRLFSLDVSGQYKNESVRRLDDLIPELKEKGLREKIEIMRERNGTDLVLQIHINKHSRAIEKESGWVLIVTDITKEFYDKENLEKEVKFLSDQLQKEKTNFQLVNQGVETQLNQIIDQRNRNFQFLHMVSSRITDACKSYDSKTLSKLQNQFSNYADIDMANLNLTNDPVDLSQLILDLKEELENDLDIKISVNFQEPPKVILTSSPLIRQLIVAMIMAVKQVMLKSRLDLNLKFEDLGNKLRVHLSAGYTAALPDIETRKSINESMEGVLVEQLVGLLGATHFDHNKNDFEKEYIISFVAPSAP